MTEAGPQPSDNAAAPPPTTVATSRPTAAASATATATASDAPYTYYYQYCFPLSPTFNKWCPMRVSDLLRLDEFDAFEGQNIFFHKNHPIKWVRVAGVVVSFADHNGRHVYGIDDGSGMAIDCVVPSNPLRKMIAAHADGASASGSAVSENHVGKVIEVRGELHLYRSWRDEYFLQIQVVKLTVLRSTQQEMQFWKKVNAFARATLDKPWVLDKQTVRACRKAAYAVSAAPQADKASTRAAATAPTAPSATTAPQPPPPRRKKKWRLRPDTPERAVPSENTGDNQRSHVGSSCGTDSGVHVKAEPSRLPKPRKGWDFGSAG